MFDQDNHEREAKRRFSRRTLLVGAGQMAGLSVLGWRLFQLQVVNHGRYAPLADENRISLQALAPKRGRILDRNGLVLADNEEHFRATLTPGLAGDVAHILSLFRRIVPLQHDELEKLVRRAKKQSRNTSILIATDLSFEQVAEINLFAPRLPGIATQTAWRRKYRQGPATGHVVGYVGNVERVGLDDDAVMRLPGMKTGKSGIEAGMEKQLRGQGGTIKIEVDAHGHAVRDLESQEPKEGRDVVLTIDAALQKRILDRLMRERRASCVVLDVTSGEVVVMASVPGFDPGDVAEGISNESWQRLVNAEDKPLLNRAIAGQYPPGSTFKLVTALAALQKGYADPDEHISCQGTYDLADHSYRCWKRTGHGAVGFRQAVKESCDVYFYEMAKRLGIDALAEMARKLGLGMVYPCGLPQQKAGVIPDGDWKRAQTNTSWLGGETVLAGIGQGYVLATPLQLAVMTARVATGRAVVPALERGGQQGRAFEFPALDIDERNLQAVRDAMVAAVNEDGGTGVKAALGDAQSIVAGKTGTSQVSQASSDSAQDALTWEERDHALFVAFVPASKPRFAISAIIEHGGGGGATAAPFVRDCIEAVLEAFPQHGQQG